MREAFSTETAGLPFNISGVLIEYFTIYNKIQMEPAKCAYLDEYRIIKTLGAGYSAK